MINLLRFRNLVVAVGLLAAQGCNKSDSAKHADNAADKVSDKADDLRDERKDLGDKKVDEVKQSKKVVEEAQGMADAKAEFEARRTIRYQALEAELQVINTQPQLINAIAQNFPLTADSRADVTDKLQKLQMRYDEARNQVELLKTSSADNFKDADDKARDAMDKLHDARKDAWDAVKDAHRTDRSS
jgi:hypothetical protein